MHLKTTNPMTASGSLSHVRTLYQGRLIHILDYRCSGEEQRGEELPRRHEIVLPRAGVYIRRDALGTVLADPNQILFFNQNQPYEINHPLQGEDCSTVFLLHPPLLMDMLRSLDRSVEERIDKPFLRSSIVMDTRLRALQYWLIRMGKDCSILEPLQVEEQILSLLGEVLQRALQTAARNTPQISSRTLRQHAELVHTVKVLLNHTYPNHIGLDEIAAEVYASPYHLCRIFKRVTGMSIHQYLVRLRLFNAAERLAEAPSKQLDYLALDFGFANHSHFTTTFRQTLGLTPSDFRQMSKILKV